MAIGVFRGTTAQQLVWTNVAHLVHDAGEATTVHVPGRVFVAKRGASEANERLATALRSVVAASKLPLESEARVRLFAVDVVTGEVTPSPAEAFRRLVELAFLKLDFLSSKASGLASSKPMKKRSKGASATRSRTASSSARCAMRSSGPAFPARSTTFAS